jgi:peptidoglycan LD-endopeptidase LytH
MRELTAICLALAFAAREEMIPPISGLSASRLHSSFLEERNGHRHQAIDIMAERGTPVLAVVDGTVEKLFLSKPGGNTIYEFDGRKEYCYYYAHLDHYAEGVQEGTRVLRGDVIGYIGSTGDAHASAPHLHFEIHLLGPEKHWWQGTPIDPYPVLLKLIAK